MDERTYFYLRRHPITEEISVRGELFIWRDGEWVLPDHQASLPNIVEGSEFHETYEAAVDALREGENDLRRETG